MLTNVVIKSFGRCGTQRIVYDLSQKGYTPFFIGNSFMSSGFSFMQSMKDLYMSRTPLVIHAHGPFVVDNPENWVYIRVTRKNKLKQLISHTIERLIREDHEYTNQKLPPLEVDLRTIDTIKNWDQMLELESELFPWGSRYHIEYEDYDPSQLDKIKTYDLDIDHIPPERSPYKAEDLEYKNTTYEELNEIYNNR